MFPSIWYQKAKVGVAWLCKTSRVAFHLSIGQFKERVYFGLNHAMEIRPLHEYVGNLPAVSTNKRVLGANPQGSSLGF
jgi:hypothetical protein